MYGSLRDNISVQAIAQVDWIDIVTVGHWLAWFDICRLWKCLQVRRIEQQGFNNIR